MSKKPVEIKEEDALAVKSEQGEHHSPIPEEDRPNDSEEGSNAGSESSEEGPQDNEYEKDGFVVGDDEFEDEMSQGSVGEGGAEGHAEKKTKKKRKRVKEMELDEDDLELLAEAEENKESSHRRLKKNLVEDEEAEEIGEEAEEEEDQNFIVDNRGRKKMKTGNYENNHTGDIMRTFYYDEMEAGEEVEEQAVAERKKRTLEDIFEPEELEEKFAGEEDVKIRNTDVPERLQLAYKDRPAPTQNELQAESVWIFEKIKKLRNNPLSEAHRAKIFAALNNFRFNNLEVMFQAYYRKNELMGEIGLNDLWTIFELDEEWGAFYAEKEEIKKDMVVLENSMKISKSITDLFFTTYEKLELDFIQDFISYHLSKYLGDKSSIQIEGQEEQPKTTFKRPLRRLFAQEAIQVKLDQIAKIAGLSADQLFENVAGLEATGGKLIHVPRYVNSTPEKVIDDYRNPSNVLTIDTLSTMMNLCKYMANDLFYHPCVRKWARQLYIEKVTVSTEPTNKGRKDLDVTSPNYIVKRINRRPIGLFVDDLWLRIASCEEDGLITVKFMLPWENERKGKDNAGGHELKDEIYAKLLSAYLAPFGQENSSAQEQDIVKQWNVLRDEVLRIFLTQLLYPNLEKMLREQLRDKAEKYVAKVCAEKFRSLLNIAPYLIEEGNTDDSEKKRKATMVAVVIDQASSGKIGVVYCDQNGELVDHLVLKFFAIAQNERNNPEIQDSYNKDKEEFDKFIVKFKPDVIAISANCLEAKRIKQMIADYKDTELKTRSENGEDIRIPWITYGDNIVPQLFAKTKKAEKEFKGFPTLIKEAVSLARLMQNPMAEVLNLWANKIDDNPVFFIPMHPLQSIVNKSLLNKEYERVAIEMVNSVGVDINEVIAHRHGANQLQFLCGLGPRKAAHFLEFMSNPNMLNVGVLRFRSEVYISKMFEKCVYFSVAAFLKIRVDRGEELGKREALDSTRIHPENYILAKKIARDALDEDVSENMQDWVPKIMKDSVKLKDLDLEDYANHLSAQKQKPNMIHVLRFIEKELTCPFEDPRSGKKELENKDLFYRLCKENPLVFRPHSFVTVRIFKINQRNLLCKISENGLIGTIDVQDIVERKENINEDLTKNPAFQMGQILRAKIKAINFENEINGDDQKKKKTAGHDLRVELTIKPSEMRITKLSLKELFPNWESIEKHFRVIEEEDFPHFMESNKGQIRYIPRKINHPKFKNISIALAMSFLNDRGVGEYVIRPSSKGTEHLNITWKFYEKVLVHLDVREGPKNPSALVSNKFFIGKDQFDSLDEIIEKYINKCNLYMKAIVSHPKFRKEDLDMIEQELISDKQQDSKRIPYYFGCFESSPHYVVLCYLLNRNEIIKEYIKVKPNGLFFHNLYFQNLPALILWFKENFKSAEYQRYLKKVKPPYSDLEPGAISRQHPKGESNIEWGVSSPGPNADGGWNTRDEPRIKEEKVKDERVKRENAAKSNAVCNTCGKQGHTANECQANKRGGFRPQGFDSASRYSRGSSQERTKRPGGRFGQQEGGFAGKPPGKI